MCDAVVSFVKPYVDNNSTEVGAVLQAMCVMCGWVGVLYELVHACVHV